MELSNCFFITQSGNLIQVFCPFKVIAHTSINEIMAGEIFTVEAVKKSQLDNIVFQIGNQFYYHHYFELLI